MCGIVGAVAQRDVVPILMQGLKRLEYRGYDSAGLAVISDAAIVRRRESGKISALKAVLEQSPLSSSIGIAHTRWATHGKPVQRNAHPHISDGSIAVVHNGIIENYKELRKLQQERGYTFESDTDTEVIAHQIHWHLQCCENTEQALRSTIDDLQGAYAVAVLNLSESNHLFVVRKGSPVVIGLGIGEHFVASDVNALLPVTNRFIFLEDGDIAVLEEKTCKIMDQSLTLVEREVQESDRSLTDIDRGPYRHFMLKEIFEQPAAIAETLEGRLLDGRVLEESLGGSAKIVLDEVNEVRILACGTSYHAGMVARYWFEALGKIPCQVEIASEFRHRSPIVNPRALILVISQSGETADTLAALEDAKQLGFQYTLAICNVSESRLVRECEIALLTRAGPEIGVASTKAFTTQLVALMLLVILLGRRHGMSLEKEKSLVQQLEALPKNVEKVLKLSDDIEKMSEKFADKHHALFLGRGSHYPVLMEGALKLKEISYIHAEAYPAGELKHGPLALVDEKMPVVAIAPENDLIEKLAANLHEVKARGGQLFLFVDAASNWQPEEATDICLVEGTDQDVSPIILTVPLQLLAYYVALIKGTDIDQPRNLAKSVTVE